MGFTPEQKDLLAADLDGAQVKTRQKGSMKLSYIEGWKAIERANEIFGFDGWSRVRSALDCVHTATDAGREGDKCEACYVCTVRIEAGGVAREGTGYGNGIAKTMGDAHEGAVKEAETDAMKRAMMTFGYPFGLALYDKTQAHVTGGTTNGTKAPVASDAGDDLADLF